jgi:hypothetical protein
MITVLATFFSSGARVAQAEKKAGARKTRCHERKEPKKPGQDRENLPEFFNFEQAGFTERTGCESTQDILYPTSRYFMNFFITPINASLPG